MKKTLAIIIMLCILFVTSACGKNEINNVPTPLKNITPSTNLAGYHECTNPRPEICTKEYAPVCGITKNGNRTYATGCTACANPEVAGYVQKECVDMLTENPPRNIPFENVLGYVECNSERPKLCPKEYDPVCAKIDTGIKCIKAPCPSEEFKTYSTGCTACSDPKVYSYVPSECTNDAADATGETKSETPTESSTQTKPSAKLAAPKAICDTNRTKNISLEAGFTCVESCEQDNYTTQMGLQICIDHYGKTQAIAMSACKKSTDCPSETICAYVLRSTDGKEIDWSNSKIDSNNQPIDSLRCIIQTYANFAINTGGVYQVDENGKLLVTIA